MARPARIQFTVEPDHIDDRDYVHRQVVACLGGVDPGLAGYRICRKSVDARNKAPRFCLQVELIEFPDGKLYTRSLKRGDHRRVLNLLVAHGAPEAIRIDAHPHIGSDKLPGIVGNIRKTILSCGGEIHFNTRVTDFILARDAILGVRAAKREYFGDAVILATGHSARDIYTLLHARNLHLEAKPFALGVRVEHPQVRGLYPCGEGAGYAGGIMSSALDGQHVAHRIAER